MIAKEFQFFGSGNHTAFGKFIRKLVIINKVRLLLRNVSYIVIWAPITLVLTSGAEILPAYLTVENRKNA